MRTKPIAIDFELDGDTVCASVVYAQCTTTGGWYVEDVLCDYGNLLGGGMIVMSPREELYERIVELAQKQWENEGWE